jgi:hypothetical protein
LQCLRLEAFDLDDNLAAARRPEAEIDPAAWLQLGAYWQAPDGRAFGCDKMVRKRRPGRRHRLQSPVRKADA